LLQPFSLPLFSLLSATNQVTPFFDIQFFIGFCMFCGKRNQRDLRLRADEGAAWLLGEPSVTAGAHDVDSLAPASACSLLRPCVDTRS
jgi:hypothetical protein